MKLLTLYGAPATGKLTTGKVVARHTGFLLFHNHLTFAVANAVFSYGTAEFAKLCWDLRMAVFESAAAAGKDGLIFTWAYSDPEHRRYLALLESLTNDSDVELLFAHLVCDSDERNRRVSNKSRVELGKISSLEQLSEVETEKNYSPIPGRTSLTIDTARSDPDEAARTIINYFDLPVASGRE